MQQACALGRLTWSHLHEYNPTRVRSCAAQAMGNKTTARAMATEIGVPVVPGTETAMSSAEEAHAFADSAGFPIILKAAFGGGGRGMRVVRSGEIVDDSQGYKAL